MQIEIAKEQLVRAFSACREVLEGKKTHLLVLLGMVVVAFNHFHQLPEWMGLGDLKPENWLQDEWKLAVGSTLRAALAKGKG